MAGLKLSALLIVAGVLCAGCDQFYTNQFAALGLDKPAAPAVADYKGVDGLDNLAADLDSPAVVALLIADPATVAAIQAYLDTTYNLSAEPTDADSQTAAALSADLGLKTSQGDDLVNNVVTTIMNDPSGNIGDLIKSIIPPSVLADSSGGDFAAMVDALLAANLLYDNLGASINTLGGAPPGMNLGDVAQKAAVAFLMDAVVAAVMAAPPTYTQAGAEAQMYLLVTDQANAISAVTVADPFSPMSAHPNLKYIFDAAGAPYPA